MNKVFIQTPKIMKKIVYMHNLFFFNNLALMACFHLYTKSHIPTQSVQDLLTLTCVKVFETHTVLIKNIGRILRPMYLTLVCKDQYLCMVDKFHLTFNFQSKVSRDVFKNKNGCQLTSTYSSKMSPQGHVPSSTTYMETHPKSILSWETRSPGNSDCQV